MVKVKIIDGVVDGKKSGTIELTESEANYLASLGYIERVEEAPKQAVKKESAPKPQAKAQPKRKTTTKSE